MDAEASPAAMLRCGIEAARSALVTVLDPRDLYGPEFVGDLLLAMSYADAEMVGKGTYYSAPRWGQAPALGAPAARHRYLDEVMASAWLARRDFVQRVGVAQLLVAEGARPVMRATGAVRIRTITCASPRRTSPPAQAPLQPSALARSGPPMPRS